MIPFDLSQDLAHTWFIDLDGTVLEHNRYLTEQGDRLLPGVHELWQQIPADDVIVICTGRAEQYRMSTLDYLSSQGLRYNHAIFGLPLGERIVVNDDKPSGLRTALAWPVRRNEGFDPDNRVLIFAHTDRYIDNLDHCQTFNQVFTYQIKHSLERQGYQCLVIAAEDWLGVKKQKKSYYDRFVSAVDQSLFSRFNHALFVGAIPLKIVDPRIVAHVKENISGFVGEFNEYIRNPRTDHLFYANPESEQSNCTWIGPMYDAQHLYPEQPEDRLIIHIDHHFPGRWDASQRIKELIQELPDHPIFKSRWRELEVWYHSRRVDNIDDWDFYDRPPDIAFSKLSAIYRQSHIGFISHRETLGMYPIELAAAGALVVLLNDQFLSGEMKQLITTQPDADDFWDQVLPQISAEQAQKRSKAVVDRSYDRGICRVIEHIQSSTPNHS